MLCPRFNWLINHVTLASWTSANFVALVLLFPSPRFLPIVLNSLSRSLSAYCFIFFAFCPHLLHPQFPFCYSSAVPPNFSFFFSSFFSPLAILSFEAKGRRLCPNWIWTPDLLIIRPCCELLIHHPNFLSFRPIIRLCEQEIIAIVTPRHRAQNSTVSNSFFFVPQQWPFWSILRRCPCLGVDSLCACWARRSVLSPMRTLRVFLLVSKLSRLLCCNQFCVKSEKLFLCLKRVSCGRLA